MTSRSLPSGSTTFPLLLLLACPGLVEAQQFPSFGGIEARLGVAAPENADPGLSAAVDLDLGSLGIGSLRTVAGFHYFSVNRDVDAPGGAGSYTATGGRLGLRLDFFGTRAFTPYGLAALTGHSVDADVADPETSDLLQGFYVGAAIGAGAALALDQAGRVAVTAEARRTIASNIGHYAVELGVRFLPRGAASYARAGTETELRLAIERERREAEQRRLAEERLATERARTEQERLAAERARAEQERERLARMTEEERRRAGQQVERAEQETELARQQAAAAEQARQAEAEARARAERAAAEAAAREDAAARAAREAEQRAAEAERRLYDSLLDLERLIANVTGIRETERGLAVVVGQGLFASGQASLSARARDEVSRIAAVLRQFADHRISVEGHTDSVGSEVSNQRLSEQRAESVRAALVAEGVDPGRVDAVGFGQSRPIADNQTAAGRAQNRRVEIVILGARRPTGP
jgi:outer membrane protein OmpA-like peptidoglycan-associated protein